MPITLNTEFNSSNLFLLEILHDLETLLTQQGMPCQLLAWLVVCRVQKIHLESNTKIISVSQILRYFTTFTNCMYCIPVIGFGSFFECPVIPLYMQIKSLNHIFSMISVITCQKQLGSAEYKVSHLRNLFNRIFQ